MPIVDVDAPRSVSFYADADGAYAQALHGSNCVRVPVSLRRAFELHAQISNLIAEMLKRGEG